MQNLMTYESKKQDCKMEELFWDIFNSKDENELHKLVTTNSLLNNDNNWFPYGGKDKTDRSNFGTFENQQPNAIPALIEKVTNSIDSLLMKECKSHMIAPDSNQAPKNMAEAVEKFFGIKNGDFSEINEGSRRDIAENIQIIASDNTAAPNILIYDNGEGQHPDNFPKTFLSIAQNNKVNIHFVQGKYNMGSTGAVTFCGKYRYQLIASKLHNTLHKDSSSNDFGFTLVRIHPLTQEQEDTCRTSWYEYLCIDDKIPRFAINELEIGLYKRKFTTGSIVKLYSYELPTGYRSDITLDLWRALNQYLYQPALPILVYETRFGKSHSPSKLVLGNKTRITIDDRDQKEETITIEFSNKEIGCVNIEATVFNHNVKQKEFIKDKAVIFTVNGQVHGSLPRSFISQSLGLSFIRDHLLVQVDCTNIRTSFRQNLFMANRHNLKESSNLEILLKIIVDKIKTDGRLKELNELRKNRIFHDNTQDKELIKSLIKTIPINDDLMNLLKKHGDLNFLKDINNQGNKNHNGKKTPDKEDKPAVSNRFPSIFKIQLKEDEEGKRIKSIPLNGKGVIEFETDVENEYFFRPKEKGELSIEVLEHKRKGNGGGEGKPTEPADIFEITKTGPTNNSIKIIMEPRPENVNVGDEIKINARLSSPNGDLESIFYVKIIDPQKTEKKPKVEKNEDNTNLPDLIRVYEKENLEEDKTVTWREFGWTGEDIVKFFIDNDNKEFSIDKIAVNMDSFVLKRYISKNKINTEVGLNTITNKYLTTIYSHSLYLYGIIDKQKKINEEYGKISLEDFIPELFKHYSHVLLYALQINDNTPLVED